MAFPLLLSVLVLILWFTVPVSYYEIRVQGFVGALKGPDRAAVITSFFGSGLLMLLLVSLF